MPLIPVKKGRQRLIGMRSQLVESAEKFAADREVTLESVCETALEEFLARAQDAGGEEEPEPAAPARRALAPAPIATTSDFVVLRLEGRGPERLARIVERKPTGHIKCRHQTFGGTKRLVEAVLIATDVVRPMDEKELLRWQELEPAAVLPPGLRNIG